MHGYMIKYLNIKHQFKYNNWFIIGISRKWYFILNTFNYYINIMVCLIIDYLQFNIASRSKDALIVNTRYGHSNH